MAYRCQVKQYLEAGENPGGFSGNFTDGGSSDNPVQGGCCDVAHPGLNVGGGANDLEYRWWRG